MTTTAVAQATRTTSARSTITRNLFSAPTGACSLALSIAGLQIEPVDDAQQTSSVGFAAQVVSNPDIAGIGVLIAFLSTAYGIFVWMLAAYVCGWLPEPLLGQVDIFVFKRSALKQSRLPWWQNAVNQSILAYADLQIATGIGILVAACSTINSLSVYHLQVAIYLAWMSSNTHLTALSLLQIDFRENRNKSIARRLRVGGMILLGLFLLVALVPTTAYNWLLIITQSQARGNAVGRSHDSETSAAGIPARCFWQSRYTGGRTADSAWPFIILVSSYAWKGLLLFQRSHKAVKNSCRRRVLQPLQRSLDHLLTLAKRTRRHENHRWLFLRYKLVFCLYLGAWAVFQLAQSFVVSLWICGGGLVWGSFQILVPRQRLPAQAFEAESSWNFGQILPIMFLGVPIFSFAQGYTIQKAEEDRKHDLNTTPPSPTSVEDQSSTRNIDEAPSSTQTPMRRSANVAATSNTISISTRGTWNGLEMAEETIGRGPGRLPPWRDDSQIYASHFIVFAFWGSQVGILALATFIVFYRGLFLPLGIFVQQETRQALLTDSWIWLIVGCTIGTYILVAIALLVGGAMYSSLFVVDNVEIDEGEEL